MTEIKLMTMFGRNKEEKNSHRRRGILLILGVIFLFLILMAYEQGWVNKDFFSHKIPEPISQLSTTEPVSFPDSSNQTLGIPFTLDAIMGAETTIVRAQRLKEKNIERDPSLNVKMMVLPHHAYVVDEIDEAWARLRRGSDPSVIVLIGPNHDDLDNADIQTTDGSWATPIGSVTTDQSIVNALVQAGAVKTKQVFLQDHSIGVHIPYVAALFPKAKIVPIVFRHQATIQDAQTMLTVLKKSLPADAVFVYSIDFSHYLNATTARSKDIQTWTWMTSVHRDPVAIDAGGTEYFDSHTSVNMFLAAADAYGCEKHVTWYGNSGDVANDSVGQTTSYFVWMCDAVPKNMLTIEAGGDVMLDRSIAPIRKQKGATDFMHDISIGMYGADIRFANLESVISDKGNNSQKSISFRADPSAMDSVKAGGFSVVSVSNNHAIDWGREAWNDSVARLTAAGIIPIGSYKNTETKTVVETINGKKVAFVAFDTVDQPLDAALIQSRIKAAAAEAPFVIASFHWGSEYEHTPRPEIQVLAHAAIDVGADLVIGHHPHWLQGFEVYKDKLIAYSLGNLVFDQNEPEGHQSLLARIVVDENGKGSLELKPMQIDSKWVTRFAEPKVRMKTIQDVAGWSFGNLKEGLGDGFVSW